MAICRNPHCEDRAWWSGYCRVCFQTTGVADRLADERAAQEQADRAARRAAAIAAANDRLVGLGDGGVMPWWEISERLNADGLRLEGRPFTPATARGRYLELTADRWE